LALDFTCNSPAIKRGNSPPRLEHTRISSGTGAAKNYKEKITKNWQEAKDRTPKNREETPHRPPQKKEKKSDLLSIYT
jgi:hypothetical protein